MPSYLGCVLSLRLSVCYELARVYVFYRIGVRRLNLNPYHVWIQAARTRLWEHFFLILFVIFTRFYCSFSLPLSWVVSCSMCGWTTVVVTTRIKLHASRTKNVPKMYRNEREEIGLGRNVEKAFGRWVPLVSNVSQAIFLYYIYGIYGLLGPTPCMALAARFSCFNNVGSRSK